MLIRSQSKKGIANLDNISYIYVAEVRDPQSDIIVYWIDTEKEHLGEYLSEKKAIKVLDMIENTYHGNMVEEVYHEGIHYFRPVFQMPQDSEVQL